MICATMHPFPIESGPRALIPRHIASSLRGNSYGRTTHSEALGQFVSPPMKIFNFGSINIDHVYEVDELVRPGQTIACRGYHRFCGGKGSNQTIALAYAGANVVHIGKVGTDGGWASRRLAESGADISLISTWDGPTGHALIQVDRHGENAIIVHGAANHQINDAEIVHALRRAEPGDFVLTQNETSGVASLLRAARERHLFTVFNPTPQTEALKDYPLALVDLFILNEPEAGELVGGNSAENLLDGLQHRFPNAAFVLTLGREGAFYRDQHSEFRVRGERVTVVDTTAAGDTLIGYFVAELAKHSDPETCLQLANRAASLCVQRRGAADSIPRRHELAR